MADGAVRFPELSVMPWAAQSNWETSLRLSGVAAYCLIDLLAANASSMDISPFSFGSGNFRFPVALVQGCAEVPAAGEDAGAGCGDEVVDAGGPCAGDSAGAGLLQPGTDRPIMIEKITNHMNIQIFNVFPLSVLSRSLY